VSRTAVLRMTDMTSTTPLVPTAAAAARPAVRRSGSLQRRLPLIISLFLVAVVGAGGTASYLQVRHTVLEAAHGRLQTNARNWSQILAPGLAQRLEEARRAAANPALQRRLIADDPATVAAAQAQLQTLLKSAPQNLSVELWSASGQRVAHAMGTGGPEGPGFPKDATFPAPRAPGTMPLGVHGDLIYSEHVADVKPPAGAADGAAGRGFVVFRRRAASPTAGRAIGTLLGAGNALRLGSRSNDVWTDLGRRVEPPPKTSAREVVSYRRSDGTTWLGTEGPVAGTPWVIWAETPEALALATAHTFWNAMLPIGALFVGLGGLLAWVISRRITTPLASLTAAAEAIAGGDLARRVEAKRSDEVGRLADAFNVMADQVQAGYSRLDTGIKERTAELEQTVAQLHDTQEQLVRREKLAMLGQLASGVGHELRNPLGVMTNAVYYLEMVQPDASQDVQEYLGILRSQIGLAEKIVGDLLDFSRVRPPRRDVAALADIVAAQQARLAVPPTITLTVDMPADLPRVSVDVVQIGQIVFNLMLNAMQALGDHGGAVQIGASAADGHVHLHVEDDGPGVPADLRAKIFEPLFTTKARGIGLGLAVSRSLAEANGGTLTLDDGGRGARFTLSLPRDGSGEPS
jgi:signal transduction histidine kinase